MKGALGFSAGNSSAGDTKATCKFDGSGEGEGKNIFFEKNNGHIKFSFFFRQGRGQCGHLREGWRAPHSWDPAGGGGEGEQTRVPRARRRGHWYKSKHAFVPVTK